jgi:predicted DNA binding CopG/RHH family protein/uncharacterized DUF497 family protein
VLFEKYCL